MRDDLTTTGLDGFPNGSRRRQFGTVCRLPAPDMPCRCWAWSPPRLQRGWLTLQSAGATRCDWKKAQWYLAFVCSKLLGMPQPASCCPMHAPLPQASLLKGGRKTRWPGRSTVPASVLLFRACGARGGVLMSVSAGEVGKRLHKDQGDELTVLGGWHPAAAPISA